MDTITAEVGAGFKPALTIICTQSRQCLFGEIVDGEMRLNDAGQMVQSVWSELAQHYAGVEIDGFVVMPNHIHEIVILTPVGAGFVVSSAERPRCLPCKGATTGGCPYDAVAGCCASV